MEKTNKLLDAYYKRKQEKPKLKEPKKTTGSEKKRKTPSSQDSVDKDLGSNAAVNKTLKKLKIDSDKESLVTGKDPASDSEMPMEKPMVEEPPKDSEADKSKKKQSKSPVSHFFIRSR